MLLFLLYRYRSDVLDYHCIVLVSHEVLFVLSHACHSCLLVTTINLAFENNIISLVYVSCRDGDIMQKRFITHANSLRLIALSLLHITHSELVEALPLRAALHPSAEGPLRSLKCTFGGLICHHCLLCVVIRWAVPTSFGHLFLRL